MLKIHSDYSLRYNNTFGVDIACSYFCEPVNLSELSFAIDYAKRNKLETLIIGEGSNLLLCSDFDGLVIHPKIIGVELVDESSSELLVKAGSGVNWDEFVAHCVKNHWYGVENMSFIPGSTGAAPIQNIGAYGCEVKDSIEYVEVLNSDTLNPEVLSNAACEFGYRDSMFKHGKQGKFIVTQVIFRLTKNGDLNLDYGNVREVFSSSGNHTLEGLRNAIIKIRQEKLPDPNEYGNAGSFFKNPVIDLNTYEQLKTEYGTIPGYPAGTTKMKIPAAWFIDNAGLKGLRRGKVGTWPAQPLVVVNYGGASGKEIRDFSENIKDTVMEKFGVPLEPEVRIVG